MIFQKPWKSKKRCKNKKRTQKSSNMYRINNKENMRSKWPNQLLQLRKKEKSKNCEKCKKRQLTDKQILMLSELNVHLKLKREKHETEKNFSRIRKNVSWMTCIWLELNSFKKKKWGLQNRPVLKKNPFSRLLLNRRKMKTKKEELLIRDKMHSITTKMIYYCKFNQIRILKSKWEWTIWKKDEKLESHRLTRFWNWKQSRQTNFKILDS